MLGLKFCPMALVIGACLLLPSLAMFEEQAGEIDWTREQVGVPEYAVFNHQSRRVCVGTASSVLAALSTKTGELLWRQVLPAHEQLAALQPLPASKQEDAVVSLSLAEGGLGVALRTWRVKDGALLWDWGSTGAAPSAGPAHRLAASQHSALQPARTGHASLLLLNENPHLDVLLLSWRTGQATLRGFQAQALLWTQQLSGPVRRAQLVSCGQGAAVLVQAETGGLSVLSLNTQTGDTSLAQLPEPLGTQEGKQQQWAAVAGWLGYLPGNGQLQLYRLACSAPCQLEVTLADSLQLPPQLQKELRVQALGVSSFAVGSSKKLPLRVEKGKLVAEEKYLTPQGGQRKEKAVKWDGGVGHPGVLVAAHSSAATSGDVLATCRLGARDRLDTYLQAGPGQPIQNVGTTLTPGRGRIVQVFLDAYKKGNTQDMGYRQLVVMSDGSLLLAQGGRVSWLREEALASLVQVGFHELPLASAFNEDTGFPALPMRLVGQMRALTAWLKALPGNVQRIAHDQHKLLSQVMKWDVPAGSASANAPAQDAGGVEGAPLARDTFGMRQVLLAASRQGKIFGLGSEKGDLLWSQYLFTEEIQRGWELWKVVPLTEHAMHAQSVAICRMYWPAIKTMQWKLFYFNPLNGQVLSSESVELAAGAELLQVYPLTSVRLDVLGHHARALLLLDSQYRVQLVPDRPSTWELFKTQLNHTFLFHTHQLEEPAAALRGYRLQGDVKTKGDKAKALSAQLTWSLQLPTQEQVAVLAMRDPAQRIQSRAKKIGKGDKLLWKYMNPNLLVLATTRRADPSPALIPSLKKELDPAVTIYLIDVVTGHMLDRIYHKQCTGPVHMVIAENRVIYHYWNLKQTRHEMSVLELYEDQELKENLKQGLAQDFSSFLEPNPVLFQQSFRFPSGAILVLGATDSKHGVTDREILVGLADGQVAALNHRLLDARRPVEEPNELHQAEGLIPYETDIYVDDKKVISYNHSIPRLSGLSSSPTELESTSLVVAWGLDLFLVRVTPSGFFDLLDPDFNHHFLVLTVTSVLLLLLVTNVLSKRKTLELAWA
eukprot:g38498.t1